MTLRAASPHEQEVAEAREAAGEAVARLLRLRHAERGGEAHTVLSTATGWPALHLAVLVGELQRNGLDADAGTLLWEAAALPAAEFADAAGALATAGRSADSARLLRQGVARPLPEIADVALTLHRAGHRTGVRELLAALIRSRTPTEAAQIIARQAPGPHRGAAGRGRCSVRTSTTAPSPTPCGVSVCPGCPKCLDRVRRGPVPM